MASRLKTARAYIKTVMLRIITLIYYILLLLHADSSVFVPFKIMRRLPKIYLQVLKYKYLKLPFATSPVEKEDRVSPYKCISCHLQSRKAVMWPDSELLQTMKWP